MSTYQRESSRVGVCGSGQDGSSPSGPREAQSLLPVRPAPRTGGHSQDAGQGCSSALGHHALPPLRWDQGGDASPSLSHVLEKVGWLRFPCPSPPPPPHTAPVSTLLTHFLQKTLCQGRCQRLGRKVVPGKRPTVGPKL